MKTILAISALLFATGAMADGIVVDLTTKLADKTVAINSSIQQIDIQVPSDDTLHASIVGSTLDGGCSVTGYTEGGMIMEVFVHLGASKSNESCKVRLTEDSQVAVVTLVNK